MNAAIIPRACPLRILLACLLAFAACDLHAAALDSGFESANKLFEQGKFSDAAAAYDTLLQSGRASAAVYFNRGNALFQLGQLGRAVASYRQAQLLAPRDPDVRVNLQFARNRARGNSPYRQDRWRTWLQDLSLNEWTLLTALTLWLLLLLLALGQWRPGLRPSLRNFCFAAGALALAFAIALGLAFNETYFKQSGIVITGEAAVRNGPLDESPALFKVRDGVELDVLDQKDNWFQVMDSARRVGWVRRDQILQFKPFSLQIAKPSAPAA